MMAKPGTNRLRPLLCLEAPPLFVSLLVAELWFKLGSFTLEAVAFLVLWWGLRACYQRILTVLSGRVPALRTVFD